MASGVNLSGLESASSAEPEVDSGSGSELAALSRGQKIIALDVAQVARSVLDLRGDIAKLLAAVCPEDVSAWAVQEERGRAPQPPPTEHPADLPGGEERQQARTPEASGSPALAASHVGSGGAPGLGGGPALAASHGGAPGLGSSSALAASRAGSGDAPGLGGSSALAAPRAGSGGAPGLRGSSALAASRAGSGSAPALAVPGGSRAAYAPAGSESPGAGRAQTDARDGGDSEGPPASESPSGEWPATISLRRGLEDAAPISHRSTSSSRQKHGFSSSEVYSSMDGDAPRGAWNFMVDPNSVKRTLFDALSMVALVYDLIVIPYVLAWDITFTGWLVIASWSTCIFWTVDIIFTFMTGFYENGVLQLSARKVALKYLRAWLVPDVCIASSDWVSVIMMSVDDKSTAGSLKMLRLVKAGRLLRIGKLLTAVEEYMESCLSQSCKAATTISMLFLCTSLLIHWLTCVWMAIGRWMPSDTGLRWIDTSWVMDDRRVEFMQADALYQYITAYHWNVAQFTLGAIEINCNNSWERLFNIMCLVIGLLFGSTLVSTMSATMVELQMLKKDKTVKLRKLRRFLRENLVRVQTAMLVEEQVTERLDKKAELTEQDVTVLQLLSTSLRRQLRLDIFEQYLLAHPLLCLWNSLDPTILHHLCDLAVSFLFLGAKDELFDDASTADAAYYVVSGTINYDCGREVVQQGTWFCEVALWTKWTHVGRAQALTAAKLVAVSADGTVEVLSQHPDVRAIAVDYGRAYHRKVVTAEAPTDVKVPFASWEEVVLAMGPSMEDISLHALRQMTRDAKSYSWRRGKRSSAALLHKEVLEHQSCFLINSSGEVERVIQVVVLRVERRCHQGTQVLVELGRLKGDEMKPSCELPAMKQEEGEHPKETVKRLLRCRLEVFDEKVEVESMRREDRRMFSKKLDLHTKYLRTVCTASVTDDIETTSFTVPALGLTKRRGAQGASSSAEDHVWQIVVIQDHVNVARGFFAWLTEEEFGSMSSVMSSASSAGEILSWLEGLRQQLQEPQENSWMSL